MPEYIDPNNMDDLPDDIRQEVEESIKFANKLTPRFPQADILAFCEDRINKGADTIESLEDRMSDIPDEMERDQALGKCPEIGESLHKYHRRLFIALNWRNN